MDLVLVGQQSRALVAFVPPMSIEDCSLHWTLSGHIFIIPSTYLLIGVERLVTLLSWVSVLSRSTVMVVYWVRGLSTTLRPGLQCWGLGVPVWTRTWTP
jgi:hypothetical protein